MTLLELEELRKRKRQQTALLEEAADLTRQISDAVGRKDQLSLQMLLGMRETPLRRIVEISDGTEDYLLSLPEASAIRGNELLRGGASETPEEEGLCEDVARYHRLLSSVTETDRLVSTRLGGRKSFYNTFRN